MDRAWGLRRPIMEAGNVELRGVKGSASCEKLAVEAGTVYIVRTAVVADWLRIDSGREQSSMVKSRSKVWEELEEGGEELLCDEVVGEAENISASNESVAKCALESGEPSSTIKS